MKSPPPRTRPRRLRLALCLAACLAVWLQGARPPAGIRWRQVADGRLTVVYAAGLESSAGRLLASARDLLPRLERFWGVTVRGRVRILLHDATDVANGSAGYFPFNLICIHRVEPPPGSELGSRRDWLNLVLTHELGHLVALHAGRRWLRALRVVFGNHPALFPIDAMPGWTLEGMAELGESSFDEPGRLRTADFRLMADAAGRAGEIPSYRRLTGQPTFWPGPMARYLHGGMFFRLLAERYGQPAVAVYLRLQGSPISFLTTAWGYRPAFGAKLPELWNAYRAAHPPAAAPVPPASLRLATGSGFSKRFPLEIDAGRLVYAREDFRRHEAVEEVTAAAGRPRVLFRLAGINGMSFDAGGRRLLLSAVDTLRAWREVSDLYAYDLAGMRLERLSRGLRLSDPVAHPSGGIVCVQRLAEASRLVHYDPLRRSVRPLTAAYEALAEPAISADGQRLAAALKLPGRNWGVAVFGPGGELLRLVSAADGGKWHQPMWRGDDLYFIAETESRYRPARYRAATGAVEALAGDDLPSPRHASLGGTGDELVVAVFAPRGFEVGWLPLEGTAWRPLEARTEEEPPLSPPPETPASSRYRPLSDLLPRYWTPLLRLSGQEIQLGAVSSGRDAPGTHAYNLDAWWGLRTGEPSARVAYRWGALFPDLGLTAERQASLERDEVAGEFTRRKERLRLEADWPLRSGRRWQLWLHGDLHAERTREAGGRLAPYRLDLRGVRLGLRLNTAQAYYDRIAPVDGLRLNLSLQRDWKSWGSSFGLTQVVAEYRHYVALPRPHQLAWRLALADSWGGAQRLYRLGGAASQDGDAAADGEPFGLLRGFPSGHFFGHGGWSLNLEYRLALFKVEQSVPLAINVNRVFTTLFLDAGNLWTGKPRLDPAWSIGAELDVVFFVAGVRWQVAGGTALGRRPDRPWRLFGRLGASF